MKIKIVRRLIISFRFVFVSLVILISNIYSEKKKTTKIITNKILLIITTIITYKLIVNLIFTRKKKFRREFAMS